MEHDTLKISPVYSEEDLTTELIGSIRLLKHQAETWNAFHDPEIELLFNTAMTGDGKSLAAYLPAFQDNQTVLAMYPTNELIRDQHEALKTYEQRLHVQLPRNDSMDGPKISRVMLEHDETKRIEEVRRFVERNHILLTNPDLVHLMLSHQYGWNHQRKELAVTASSYFDYFLFDEFHVFGVPQVISVMNMLGYLLTTYRDKPLERKKYIFLSATPGELLTHFLDKGGVRYKVIKGHYASQKRENYRCILQACDLHFHEVSQDATVEAWVMEHVEDMRQFFHTYPDSKAAILVYSVATARRLTTFLQGYFQPFGLSVGENTGLTGAEEKRDSLQKHILVGTSTVDIGVDFHINYLVFEASNAGSFLQRFGRLGRHQGFSAYQAHALVPRFIIERLRLQMPGSQDAVEREFLNEKIREVFPYEQTFRQYKSRWGVVQAAHVLVEMQQQKKYDANTGIAQALQASYDRFYAEPGKSIMAGAIKKYWALKAPGHAPEIIDELNSFRGQSPLSCGIWDSDDQLKIYDLFFMLTNAQYEVLDRGDFFREVQNRKLDEREFRQKHFYLRVWDYGERSQPLVLGLRHNLMEYSHIIEQATVLPDFFVREPALTGLDQINKRLRSLRLTCLLSRQTPEELRRKGNLGGIFPLYRLRDGWGQDYTVAFGEEALLLDSLLFFRRTHGDSAMML